MKPLYKFKITNKKKKKEKDINTLPPLSSLQYKDSFPG